MDRQRHSLDSSRLSRVTIFLRIRHRAKVSAALQGIILKRMTCPTRWPAGCEKSSSTPSHAPYLKQEHQRRGRGVRTPQRAGWGGQPSRRPLPRAPRNDSDAESLAHLPCQAPPPSLCDLAATAKPPGLGARPASGGTAETRSAPKRSSADEGLWLQPIPTAPGRSVKAAPGSGLRPLSPPLPHSFPLRPQVPRPPLACGPGLANLLGLR